MQQVTHPVRALDRFGPDIAIPLDWLDPNNCVVLIVDAQRWYTDPWVCPFFRPGAPTAQRWTEQTRSALARIDHFASQARSAGMRVWWSRMTEGPPTAPDSLSRRWDLHQTEPRLEPRSHAWGWAGAGPVGGDGVADKVWPDATTSPLIAEAVRGKTVILAGAYAGRCVQATAGGLVRLGCNVLVGADLVVGHPGSPHETDVALFTMGTTLGYVVESADVARTFAAG